MKNLLLTISSPELEENPEVLVRGDHTQSRSDMMEHALATLPSFLDLGELDEENVESSSLLDEEADAREGEVAMTLRMNQRTDHSYATHYYGEYWESDNTPANGPVGYSENK
jgi:hypothetical protein